MATEVAMIELTEEQRDALASGDRLARDAAADETYVLVRRDDYDQMKRVLEKVDPSQYEYDDGPWAPEEMDRLAEEAGDMLDRYRP
jgi:hypothetical protein